MTLDQFLDAARLYLSKEYPTFNMSVEMYNAALNMTNIDYFKQWAGLPEDWKPGSPVSRRGWELNEKNIQALKTFLVTNTYPVSSGQLTYPSGLVHITRIGYTSIDTGRQRPVELLTDGEIDGLLGDAVTYPTIEYPCFSYQSTYLQFYPSLQSVTMSYLRLPATPVYAVTQLYGVNQYNSVTEFEWPSNLHNDLLRILIGYLSIAAKDQLAIQVDNVQKGQGL